MTWHDTTRRNDPRGFTLVEILVMVTIIAIASAVVVPYMLEQGQMGVQAAGRIIITDILYAQNEAIAHQQSRRVVFDADKNQYSLTDETGEVLSVGWKGGTGPNYLIDFANDQRFSGVALGEIDFGGSTTIEFDALGSPTNGGTIDLSTDKVSYRISVAPMTGRVTIASQ